MNAVPRPLENLSACAIHRTKVSGTEYSSQECNHVTDGRFCVMDKIHSES